MDQRSRAWEMLKERAAAIAHSNGAEKIKDPSPATLEGLRDALANAIMSELDALKLQQALVARFSLPAARALTIARTELSRAFNRAISDLMRAGGIDFDDLNLAGRAARELYYPAALAERNKLKKPRAGPGRFPRRRLEQAKSEKIDDAAKSGSASVGISFDLSNAGLIEFVRSYHFVESADRLGNGCLARRRAARGLRALVLRSLTESWPHNKLRDAIDVLFLCGPELANQIASDETNRAANAAAFAAFVKNGITLKAWVADPDACHRCKGLDGATISMSNNFSGGCPFPPLHTGCRCAIRAEIE